MINKKIKNFLNEIRLKKEMIKRMIFWGWRMRYSYDFDGHLVYDVIHIKLKRLYQCMKTNGHLMWNSDENNRNMRRLNEAVELSKRMMNQSDYYSLKSLYETQEKFGKLKTSFVKIENSTCSKMESKWGDGTNDSAADAFNRKRRDHWDKIKKQDQDRLWYLLNNYLESWWD